MDGELNFEAGLRRWCVLLKGVLSSVLETPKLRVTLNKGVLDQTKALKRLGLRMVVLSRGFTLLTGRVAAKLGLDHALANILSLVKTARH
jgi:phosphoserine phosphatase